jgi:hypothetical protein
MLMLVGFHLQSKPLFQMLVMITVAMASTPDIVIEEGISIAKARAQQMLCVNHVLQAWYLRTVLSAGI